MDFLGFPAKQDFGLKGGSLISIYHLLPPMVCGDVITNLVDANHICKLSDQELYTVSRNATHLNDGLVTSLNQAINIYG